MGSQKKGGFLKKTPIKNFLVELKKRKFNLTSWRAEEAVGESNVPSLVASKVGIKFRVTELRIQKLSYLILNKVK